MPAPLGSGTNPWMRNSTADRLCTKQQPVTMTTTTMPRPAAFSGWSPLCAVGGASYKGETMRKRQRHWADDLKDAKSDTVAWWIYRAACFILCRQGAEALHEERCRKVGSYAHENGCGIWHACWAIGDRKRPCCCSPCMTARNETPVKI